MTIPTTYYVLRGPTDVHHNRSCVCLRMHGPYDAFLNYPAGKRACGICGGGRRLKATIVDSKPTAGRIPATLRTP